MTTLSNEYDQTIWVVCRQHAEDSFEFEIEDKGYWDKTLADKRAEHLRSEDNLTAHAWPVRFWAPIKVISDGVPPPQPVILGAITQGRGQELIAYSEKKSAQLSLPFDSSAGASERPLSQIVSDVWTAWRIQQADKGNLDEAGQAGPESPELQKLYQETPA